MLFNASDYLIGRLSNVLLEASCTGEEVDQVPTVAVINCPLSGTVFVPCPSKLGSGGGNWHHYVCLAIHQRFFSGGYLLSYWVDSFHIAHTSPLEGQLSLMDDKLAL